MIYGKVNMFLNSIALPVKAKGHLALDAVTSMVIAPVLVVTSVMLTGYMIQGIDRNVHMTRLITTVQSECLYIENLDVWTGLDGISRDIGQDISASYVSGVTPIGNEYIEVTISGKYHEDTYAMERPAKI